MNGATAVFWRESSPKHFLTSQLRRVRSYRLVDANIMFADSLQVQGGMESGICWGRPDHLAQKSKYTNVLSPSRPTDGQTPSFGRACLSNVRFWAACWGPPIAQVSKRVRALASVQKCPVSWKVVSSEEWWFWWIRTLSRLCRPWLLKNKRDIAVAVFWEFCCSVWTMCLASVFTHFS